MRPSATLKDVRKAAFLDVLYRSTPVANRLGFITPLRRGMSKHTSEISQYAVVKNINNTTK